METAPVSFLCGLHCSFLFGWLCVLFRQLRKIFYGCILFCLHDFIFSFLFLLTCFLLISVLILRLPQFFLIHQLHLFSFSNTCLTNAGLADILLLRTLRSFIKEAAAAMSSHTPDKPTDAVLTPRQSQILQYIKDYSFKNGFPPAVREIGRAVGLSSSASVHSNLKKLAQMGFLSWNPDKPRTYGVVQDNSWRHKTMVPVPLVGAVHAGNPIIADENIEDTYPIPSDLLGTKDDVFMMVVEGDSMKDAGILDRDYVFVRRQNFASNGDIVVALINGEETTIKRYFRELKQIRLQPENPAYDPIIGTDNIQIAGVVVGVFRVL